MDQAFLKGETWGMPGAAVEHIATHAAHVFLVGDRAFKIKKAVRLPYLDFSTLAKRQAVIADELEINRAFAPELYLGTTEVRGEPVLCMRRFLSRDMLSKLVARGEVTDTLARALAAMAAAAHEAAPRRDTGGADVMAGLGAQLSRAFTHSPDIFAPSDTLEFHALFEDKLHRLKGLLNARAEAGLVRRCHGDMHCENVVVLDGQPRLFDAIEFSERIATVDVLYDLAFLLMDLERRGARRAANVVLNHYLHLRRGNEDLTGLAALPLFLSTRAGVRALVTADLVHELRVEESLRPRGEALDYFRHSLALLKPPQPRLVCIGGLSGTGKTTVAQAIAPETGMLPGALIIRTDVERKVLAGVAETRRLPAESYSRQASAAVYQFAFDRAAAALRAGHAVVLDAVFAHESERRAAEHLAMRCGALFQGVWLQATPAILKARVLSRSGDASDATAEVVTAQLGYAIGHMSWAVADASGTPETTAARVRHLLPAMEG